MGVIPSAHLSGRRYFIRKKIACFPKGIMPFAKFIVKEKRHVVVPLGVIRKSNVYE